MAFAIALSSHFATRFALPQSSLSSQQKVLSSGLPLRSSFLPSVKALRRLDCGQSSRNFQASRKVFSITMKEAVQTNKAPAAVGPYSQAIKTKDTVYVSGCLGLVPSTGDFESTTDVEIQTKQALENMKAIVEAAGSSMDKVVKTTILLKDINDFAKVNAIYATYFPSVPPARSTFAVAALPKAGLIEIEAIALL